MRILHTADWHLGRRLNRVSRISEQREILDNLVEATDRLDPDVVVVAGDVFDVFTPGADAERLYYRTVQRLADDGTRPVLVVAGNHDSPSRLTAPRGLLEEHGIVVHGDPHDPDDVPQVREHAGFTIPDAGPGWLDVETAGQRARFHLVPFPSRARLPTHVDEADASATEILEDLSAEIPEAETTHLVGHLYVGSGHDVDEDRADYVGGAYAVDPDALEGYDAAFLGHLHRPFGPEGWRYAGAPMAFDFDDPALERGAWLWDEGDWSQVALEGGRPLAVEHPASVDEALSLAEEGSQAWTRLVFERGTVLARNERERVREAFGDRLVDIRFEAPDDDAVEPRQEGVDLGDVDPEDAFKRYVQETTQAPPDEDLVELFLEVLEPREPDGAESDEPSPEAAEQTTLGVDG